MREFRSVTTPLNYRSKRTAYARRNTMEKLPERIKSIRERIYRGELQFERMRDETVREVLECRKVIECLQIEIIELQNHIDGNGLFF